MNTTIQPAAPGHEESFRATYRLRDELKDHPIWQAAFEHAATRKLDARELELIGLAVVQKQVAPPKPLKWSYAITTSPDRNVIRDRLFRESVVSLDIVGFDRPRICYDPGVGAFGNWVIAATTIYHDNPWADRYAIFQDDIVCSRNLREFIERSNLPDNSYLNLCLWPGNADGRQGWYAAPDGCGLGAQTLVFSNKALGALLQSSWIVDHAKDDHNGRRAIDGIVKTAMEEAGFVEFVHGPSPVKHTGAALSTLQQEHYPETVCFMGEDFDLLTCLPAPAGDTT